MQKQFIDSDGLIHYHQKISQVIEKGDTVDEAITVELGPNATLGGYKTGDTISAGTSLETVVKKLFAKQIPPTYIAPTVSLTTNGGTSAGSYEIGTTISPQLKATFNKNDGGNLTEIKIIDVSSGTTSPLNATVDSFVLNGQISYRASATYEQGEVKNDNLGDPYPTGRIAAGTKYSGYITYTPYRQGYFWGVLNTSSDNTPLTSSIIRNGNKKDSAYSATNITGIRADSVENRKRIFIACPATNVGVIKVIMPSAMNADCTSDFVLQQNTVQVEGADGYAPIEYKVWVYEPASISDDQTFTVTLG